MIDAIQLAKYVNNSRLRIDISAVKETILEKHISNVEWVLSTKQLTNSLTKQGACAIFRLLRYRRINYNTECEDPTKETLDPATAYFNESTFSFKFRTMIVSATHYLLSAFTEIVKSIRSFKFCYLTIKWKVMKLLYLIN